MLKKSGIASLFLQKAPKAPKIAKKKTGFKNMETLAGVTDTSKFANEGRAKLDVSQKKSILKKKVKKAIKK